MRKILLTALPVVVSLLAGIPNVHAEPLGTAFTVQGKVTNGGPPLYGLFAIRFSLYDAATGGNLVAGPLVYDGAAGHPGPVPVSAGNFTAKVDFGPVYDGTALWLHIEARPNSGGAYLQSPPRQPLNVVPFALWALNGTLWSKNGDAIYYLGDVGIGTDDPDATLHVVGDGAGTTVRVTNGGTCITGNTALVINETCGHGAAAYFAGITSSTLVRISNSGSGRAAGIDGDVDISGEVDITNGPLSIGSGFGNRLLLDEDEISAGDGAGGTSTLFINPSGGDTVFGGFINVEYHIVETLNANAACPAGTNIVGGGCRIVGDAEVRGSYPLNNEWICEAGDQVGFITLTSYAICAGIK